MGDIASNLLGHCFSLFPLLRFKLCLKPASSPFYSFPPTNPTPPHTWSPCHGAGPAQNNTQDLIRCAIILSTSSTERAYDLEMGSCITYWQLKITREKMQDYVSNSFDFSGTVCNTLSMLVAYCPYTERGQPCRYKCGEEPTGRGTIWPILGHFFTLSFL